MYVDATLPSPGSSSRVSCISSVEKRAVTDYSLIGYLFNLLPQSQRKRVWMDLLDDGVKVGHSVDDACSPGLFFCIVTCHPMFDESSRRKPKAAIQT